MTTSIRHVTDQYRPVGQKGILMSRFGKNVVLKIVAMMIACGVTMTSGSGLSSALSPRVCAWST